MNNKKLICIIDVQNDFIDGALRNEEAIKVVPNIVKYLKDNINNAYVVATYDTHKENYLETQEGCKLPVVHCIENTLGHKMNNDVYNEFKKYVEKGNAYEIIKYTFGANPNDWKNIIDNLLLKEDFNKEIEILGFCTDICVVSNAIILKALYPELNISICSKLCAGVTKELHQATLDVLSSCQINIK